MKILLLGGTSFFGRDIAQVFHDAGHSVTLFTRGLQKPPGLPPIQFLKGDRSSKADLETAARKGPWDVVIDNIAYDGDQVRAALNAFAGVGQYVLTSTVSVYRYVPHRFPQPLKETSVDFDYKPADEDLSNIHWKYARGKLDAEAACARQSKVPWTILRPPLVYGPYDVTDRGFWYLARLLDGGPLLLPNGGLNSMRLAYSRDLAQSYLLAAQHSEALGSIYNIAQEEILTLRDFIEENARIFGKKPEYVSLPLETAGELGGPYAYAGNWIPDLELARKDLGFSPTPFSTFAKISADWFRTHWQGDKAKLLATRKEELALAEKWKRALQES
jgi:nucleoside-diphosphate-sugar epimerase